MKINKTHSNNQLTYIFLCILMIVFIFPIVWTVLNTFKASDELYSAHITLLPKKPVLENYRLALSKGNFLQYFFNSTFVAVIATIITVFINTMAAFALSKYHFKGREIILIIFISTLMIPLEAIMAPVFMAIRRTGLYNSLWGLIIPAAATPTGLFMMRQHLLKVPDELLEAAKIDGASDYTIFFRIILPISRTAMASLAIFSFMWRWNDFLWPLIVLADNRKYTLQLALSSFAGEFSVDWNSLLAISTLAMIPMLVVFLVFQKYFVSGMLSTGMKE